jgi:hypothetical protein
LGHQRAEKSLKAQLLAFALDNEKVFLPYGINFTVEQSARAGYTVKPTVATSLTPYVPENLPEGDLAPFQNAELGI